MFMFWEARRAFQYIWTQATDKMVLSFTIYNEWTLHVVFANTARWLSADPFCTFAATEVAVEGDWYLTILKGHSKNSDAIIIFRNVCTPLISKNSFVTFVGWENKPS